MPDEGEASVMGELLLGGIAIALSAAAIVIFMAMQSNSTTSAPVAVTATAIDTDGDRLTDTIRLRLVRDDGTPLAGEEVSAQVVGPDAVVETIYTDPARTTVFGAGDGWSGGGALYLPCSGAGAHEVVLTVEGAVAWRGAATCHQAAP